MNNIVELFNFLDACKGSLFEETELYCWKIKDSDFAIVFNNNGISFKVCIENIITNEIVSFDDLLEGIKSEDIKAEILFNLEMFKAFKITDK